MRKLSRYKRLKKERLHLLKNKMISIRLDKKIIGRLIRTLNKRGLTHIENLSLEIKDQKIVFTSIEKILKRFDNKYFSNFFKEGIRQKAVMALEKELATSTFEYNYNEGSDQFIIFNEMKRKKKE